MSYAEGAFVKDETVPQTVSSIVNATSGICKRTLFLFIVRMEKTTRWTDRLTDDYSHRLLGTPEIVMGSLRRRIPGL
jgi:hypothetical protein